MKIPFSQRFGYIKLENILVRESLTGPVLNSTYNFIQDLFSDQYIPYNYGELHQDLWLNVMNMRCDEQGPEIVDIISNEKIKWYSRIDIIEWLITHLRNKILDQRNGFSPNYRENCNTALNRHIEWLNKEYERHNYAYRIVDDLFVETTSSSDLSTIQDAITDSDSNITTHLQECLRLLSPSNQELSTRNAIKEAISAVEVSARQITCTKTLDDAFKKLVDIHPMIKNSMEKLYHYTNQKDTGIRHGWMEQSTEPTVNEAIFILVTSCSFINYLNKVYCIPQNK
ncbi:MAG: hypothetical protein NC453_28515 [Muribaculum sp.]|nr:hypothetical protein [Muribaculum sp.]